MNKKCKIHVCVCIVCVKPLVLFMKIQNKGN